MTQLSANFTKSPAEKKRYILDYTMDLDVGETIVSCVVAITSPTGGNTLTYSGLVIAPGGLQLAYFVAGGADTDIYEVQFLATTSLGKILEDVVGYTVTVKV